MTQGSDSKPTRRLLQAYRSDKELVVELGRSRITIRPKGTRRGGKAEVSIAASALYDRLLIGGMRL
jgi:hypothetical protein